MQTPLPPPRRRFSQNFLQDESTIRWIVSRALTETGSPVVEIGPGRGALTFPMASGGVPILAVELDRDLARNLRARFASKPHVRVVDGDALEIDWREILTEWLGRSPLEDPRPVIVGNLPYGTATPIVRRLFRSVSQFHRLVLMFQKEVADRLEAESGHEYGYLSVERFLATEILERRDVPAGAFHPRPKVDSSILVFGGRRDPIPAPLADRARALASAGFAHRRKKLASNLAGAVDAGSARGAKEEIDRAFAALRFSATTRAEELPPNAWVDLARELSKDELPLFSSVE